MAAPQNEQIAAVQKKQMQLFTVNAMPMSNRTHMSKQQSTFNKTPAGPSKMTMTAAVPGGRPRSNSVEFASESINKFAPLTKLTAQNNVNASIKVQLDGTVLRQGGAGAPPIPGPLDGLGIPTPKEVGDWLEEMFGKGTNPNSGPGKGNGDDDKNKDQGQRRPGGPSVEDLYPKP